MQLNKFSLVTLILLARSNRAEIVVGTARSNSSTSKLFEDLVDIVTSCYGDQIHGVGLAGNLPDTFIRTLSVEHSIPVALMGNTRNLVSRGDRLPNVPIQFRHKLLVFILEASNMRELNRLILMSIKYSIWWNHMASFFIVDRTPGCIYKLGFLWLPWRLNILNAKVICRPGSKETVIFNCNPFTSQAPVVWRQMGVTPVPVRVENTKRPFTMFVREYRGNKAICENLDFDKSKDLGSHDIFIDGYFANISSIPRVQKDMYNLAMIHKRILSTVVNVLNGTPWGLDMNNNRELNGDMRMHSIWMNGETWDHDVMTYPHAQVGFVLISQFRGHKSQLGKILTVIDYDSRIGMGIVYLITLIFFKFFVHQTLVPAILNLVRITCNTGFANLPDNNASRLFLTGLLFFVVTMQGIYQGNLASLLTTIIPLRDIETMQDVVDFGYKIYGNTASIKVVDHPEVRERYIGVAIDKQCIMHVVNDSSAACFLIASGITVDRVREAGLHMSKFIVQSYIGFQIQWDSPFEQRVNTIIQQMVEADVLEPWDIKCAPTDVSEFQFDEEVKGNKVFKTIELGELTFAFVILGIGLVCATVTYVAEVVIYSYKSRVVNVRVHKLN